MDSKQKYNPYWEELPEYCDWIAKGHNEYTAQCKACKCQMLSRASSIKQHSYTQKHAKSMLRYAATQEVKSTGRMVDISMAEVLPQQKVSAQSRINANNKRVHPDSREEKAPGNNNIIGNNRQLHGSNGMTSDKSKTLSYGIQELCILKKSIADGVREAAEAKTFYDDYSSEHQDISSDDSSSSASDVDMEIKQAKLKYLKAKAKYCNAQIKVCLKRAEIVKAQKKVSQNHNEAPKEVAADLLRANQNLRKYYKNPVKAEPNI